MRTTSLYKSCAGLLAAGLSALSQVALADLAILTPSADATLIETNPNNSSGGADFFNAGTTQNRTRNRALLQFDIAAAIPPGSVITAASLELCVMRSPVDGFEVSLVGLHRMLQSWGEGVNVPFDNPGGLGAPAMPNDATWLHRFAFTDQLWAVPGGAAGIDFSQDISSAALIFGVGGSPYQFESTDATIANVQFWLNNPGQNFGWMLLEQSEDSPFTARRYASRESFSPPLLFVEFTPVPEPEALTLGLLGVIALCLLRRPPTATP